MDSEYVWNADWMKTLPRAQGLIASGITGLKYRYENCELEESWVYLNKAFQLLFIR